MKSTQALKMMYESQVIDKIMKAEAIKVDRTDFCNKFIFDKEEFFDVRSELFSEELTANEVVELLDTTIFTGWFIDDNIEFDFSISDLLKGEILKDGSLSLTFGDEGDVLDYILTCYQAIQ